jgi:hypothetical protein
MIVVTVCSFSYPARSLGIDPSGHLVWPSGLQERNKAPHGGGALLRQGGGRAERTISRERGVERATRRSPLLWRECILTRLLRRRCRLLSRSTLFFLPVGIAHYLFDGAYSFGPSFLEVLKIQLLYELGQGRLPGLLLGIGQAAELLRVQPQIPGHLEVGMREMEALARLDPR